MRVKRINIFALLMLVTMFTISLTSCGQTNNQEIPAEDTIHAADDQPYGEQIPDEPAEPYIEEDIPVEIMLTISTPWNFNGLIEFAELYMNINPGITIVVTQFDNDSARYIETITAQLMAGIADDLMDTLGIDHRNPAINTLLADWFPIMRGDPTFNETDFYMNVFEAASDNGRLFALPTSFSYDRVAVNTTIPGLADILDGHNTISIGDMQAIHQSIATDTPIFLHENHDVSIALRWNLHNFLDFENRTAHFDTPEFIEFITEAQALTRPDKAFGLLHGDNIYSDFDMADRSQNYLFLTYVNSTHQFLLDFEEESLFSGYIPLTNDHGQLLVNFWAYALNGNTDPEVQALAWEFIRFFQTPSFYEQIHWILTPMPVYRPLAHLFLELDMPFWINYLETAFEWHISGNLDDTIANAIAQTDHIAELPMMDVNFAGQQIREIIMEVLAQFHEGQLTPEETAAQLQDSVTRALMELD